MRKPLPKISLLLILLAITGSGCLGTNAKKFGGATTGTTSPATDTTDNIVVEFALRDTSSTTTTRSVVIQARSTASSNLFANICGADATKCTCSFYDQNAMTTAITGENLVLNSELNILSCNIPSSVADASLTDIQFVRITDTTGKINSPQVRIKNALTLPEIIGTLPQAQIRRVYAYSCARTFLEGSGVSAAGISCPDGMQLAFLGAQYYYYLFQQVDLSQTNFSEKPTDIYYGNNQAICGVRILQISCSQTNVLKFGLSATQTAVFSQPIALVSSPTAQSSVTVGYAASTDSNVNCPPGLVKIRPYQAVPSTYSGGFSNFVNGDGKLNDYQIDTATATVADFALVRIAPSGTCSGGVCPAPTGAPSTVQTAPHSALGPVLCALPASLISGI